MPTPSKLFLLTAIVVAAAAAQASVENRIEGNSLRELQRVRTPGSRVSVERIPVGDALATLELERFEVWAPNAEIVVERGNGRREKIGPPPVQYFRGTVDGDPESMVFVAVRDDGAVEGTVIAHERRYRMKSRNTPGLAKDVFVEEVGLTDDAAEEPFMCELDRTPLSTPRGVPRVRADSSLPNVTANGVLSATGTWTLNLAVETDHELFTDLGSSEANVTTFIGNLVAQASVIYQRDLRTDLLIAFTRVHSSAADPFLVNPGSAGIWNGVSTTFSTQHALAELGDVWASAGTRPYNGPRSSVVLVSGKNQLAGVAWTARSCQGDFACSGGNCGSALFDGHTGGAYAYLGLGNQTSTAVPNPNDTNNGIQYGLPSNYWALLGFAHELGHNVDGPHTHCVGLTAAQKTQYGVTRNFIDECATGCFSGTTSVPPEKGTVMSYCHLLGSSQSRYTFGRTLEPSELMVTRIRSYIDSRSPASPAISAPSGVSVGSSSTASISSPVGALTYTWSITNGTINGSTTGSSVNFTANVHPVTLRVRGTNASGCSASETAAVAVNSCGPPAMTSVTPSLVLTAGSSVALEATASGAGPITFQWYVGTPGDTTTPAATGNPINAAPSTATSYWVRATNSCGSTDSGAVNVGVVTPPNNPSSLYVVSPCRLLDTRGPAGPFGGPALASTAVRDIQVTGNCGVPAGAKSVVVNLTAVAPASDGFLSFYPTGSTWPGNSTLSYRVGRTRANSALLVLSASGQVRAYNVGTAQNFIIDITGYFQ